MALHRRATCGFAISRRALLHSVCKEDVRVRGGLVPPRPPNAERARLRRSWGAEKLKGHRPEAAWRPSEAH
eukprot:12545417-Alexandrium_andersonii.AAC.1